MRENLEHREDIPGPPSVGWIVSAVAVVVALWILNWYWGAGLKDNERGVFGDTFGAVNALFSGLAFAGVAYAIVMQRYEVKLARRENRDTKKLLEAQEGQIRRQNAATEKQMFEATFFQLLRLLTDILDGVEHRYVTAVYTGKDAFSSYSEEFRNEFYNRTWDDAYVPQHFLMQYTLFSEEANIQLGHYFRTLYTVVKFIHFSNIENKKFYSNIIRAQLSDEEVEVLFFNGLSSVGREKFKPLIEEYALLKAFNAHHPPRDMIRAYDISAFGGKYPDEDMTSTASMS